ncbi:MAG: FHA domain-containing protein [Anaerolineae bacterium]
MNTTPVAPNQSVAIRAGDTITIGDMHLTWHAETEADQPAPKVTLVLPPEEAEPPESEAPAEDVGRTSAGPDDATLLIPKRAAQQVRSEEPDPTLIVPKGEPEPPAPQTPDPTLIVPKGEPEPPAPQTPDPTLIVPKGEPEPPAPQTPDPTLIVPKGEPQPPAPEVPGPTLIVPKKAAPGPQEPDERAMAPDHATPAPDDTGTYKTAWIDMGQVLKKETDLEFVSTTIIRDTRIPHLVVHMPDRTWAVEFTQATMTIGRSRSSDVTIPDESVSQHHALIERRADGYLIRDMQSMNGLWLGKQRITEYRLQEGDVLSLGRAKLVFKGGFTNDDLTLIGVPRIDGRATRRPVVFVPGLMGSELWLGSERLWPAPKTLLSNPEVYRLPGDPRIEARGILNDVVIVPNVIQLRQYSGLGDYLVAGLGYIRGQDLLEFGYDWRHDVRLSAQRLADTIERWQVQPPITIIAHSLGTLVTRYYVERLGGKRIVERIILMGGPHHGTPGGLSAILSGPDLLPFSMGAARLRDVLATFPSAYQILPTYPCVVDQDGNQIDILEDESWLPAHQRPLLGAARSFRRELGSTSSVPTVSIFGYGLKTKLRATVHRMPDGQWQKIDFVEDTAGDQSVPSGSAVLKGSEIHPVLQEHGSLYVDDDVRMRLKVELTRSTTWQKTR